MQVNKKNCIFKALIIGDVQILGRSVLAPMAGVADSAFRLMAKAGGTSLVFTELVSANGLVRNNPKSHRLLRFLPEERPIGVQIFGSDPTVMAEAARRVEHLKPEFIDLNFGCPAKRVVRQEAGAAVLKNLFRLGTIVKAVVSATPIPVSVKIRSGWDETRLVAVEAAHIIENEGACAVTVHARTQRMGFSGRANWRVVQEVKKSISIPVIGNGDVLSPEDGKRIVESTGCDLIMIGRGALGRPWIFQQVNHYLDTGEKRADPSYRERITVCLQHYDLALALVGPKRGVKEMRKHVGWYLKGMPGSARVRQEIFSIETPAEVQARLHAYTDELEKRPEKGLVS